MKDRHFVRLVFGIFLSVLAHAFCLGYYLSSLKNNDAFSINNDNGGVISIALTQIAPNDSKELLQASSENISEISNDIQAMQEKQDEKIEEEIEKFEEKEEIIEEIVEEAPIPIPQKQEKPKEKPKPKKPKKEICKDCDNELKTDGVEDKANDFNSMLSSQISAQNSVNVVGGSISSGSNLSTSTGSNWQGKLHQVVLKYTTFPQKAKERHISGIVDIRFRINSNRVFEILEVVKSSGSVILDEHALNILRKAKREFPIESFGETITIPINFDLVKGQ